MLYALLCYNDENVVSGWTQAEDDAVRPFVETKEQLLGFYVVECADLEAALDVARDLAKANPGAGGYEIRPLRIFQPGPGLP
jgi:hypothetical protein